MWAPADAWLFPHLPYYCLEGVACWTCIAPLICFWIVEWHQPDRCLRQYAMYQTIPSPPCQEDKLHIIDANLRDRNWLQDHAQFVTLWNDRHSRLAVTPHVEGPDLALPYHGTYLEWYRRITRRFVSPKGAVPQVMVSFFSFYDIVRRHNSLMQVPYSFI